MRTRFFLIPVLLILSSSHFISAAAYQPWSESVFTHINKEFGPEAEKRVRYLHNLVVANQDKSVDEKLRLVNDTMNKLPWIADKEHWQQPDYWATPIETLATFGGDCEDIAIAKWVMLRHLGVPKENLRLAYVKVKATGENHMVLAYVNRIDLPREQRLETTWILDNIDKRVLRGTERTDLLAIYATDADGNMVVFKDSAGELSILSVREKTKMQKLEEIKKKIAENTAFIEKLNAEQSAHSTE